MSGDRVKPKVIIIGAGLAGLSAALWCSERGIDVRLFEGAGHAGGRCRSFHDKYLDRQIDNGNHFIMSANQSARAYLRRVGAQDQLMSPPYALYPFVDVKSRERWTLKFNKGLIPYWVLRAKSRIPGTRLIDYFAGLKIALVGPKKTVGEVAGVDMRHVESQLSDNLLYKRLWEPLTLAVLNTTPQIGQAKLLWSVLRETFALGGQACTPMTGKNGLGPAFIDPALRTLEREGGKIQFGARLRYIERSGLRITKLHFSNDHIEIDEKTQIILALPPSRLKQVMPELDPPDDNASILNVHFLASKPL